MTNRPFCHPYMSPFHFPPTPLTFVHFYHPHHHPLPTTASSPHPSTHTPPCLPPLTLLFILCNQFINYQPPCYKYARDGFEVDRGSAESKQV